MADMLTFLDLLILMGIVHKPRLTMHWSKDNIMVTPIFNQAMRRDKISFAFEVSASCRQLTA